jgi:RHS repeat-associated protein
LTDINKAVVNEYAYTPFGIIGNQQETIPQPFKYVGQYGVMAEPNGFYYMRARYYDPAVGRFISEDPIGFDGGDVNLYAYVLNNPILFIDPWELCTGGFWNTAGIIGNGLLKAGEGLWNTLGSEDFQRGTTQGFIMAGEIAVLTHAAVATKAYALFDIATGGPVTNSIMVAAGTPQGQGFITEFIPSMNLGTLPLPTAWGLYGAATGDLINK